MTDGLKDKHRKALIEILTHCPRLERAVLFGSRAMGTFTPTSDVDIALFGDALTLTDQAKLAGAIEELTIPQQVDLVLRNTIKNPKLVEHIEKHGVALVGGLGMGPEWTQSHLGALGNVVTGRTPSKNSPEHWGEAYPFITPSDMDGRRRVNFTQRGVSEGGAKALHRALVSHGVGVSCIGWEMGKVVLIDTPSLTNQQINSIIENEEIVDRVFLYYSLLTRRSELFRLAAGGSRTPILKKLLFEKLPIVLPPLPEQRRIAAVLGALDDKIEFNRKMNQTLEAMAQALFKSWFVDFDPVIDNALRAGKPIPNDLTDKAERRRAVMARDFYTMPEYADLFPDAFVESELGSIPRGWHASTLGHETERCGGLIQTGPFGRQLHTSDYVDVGIPVMMPKNIQNRRILTEGIARITDEDADRLARHRVQDGDLVYSRRGDVEKHALIGPREIGWLCGTGCLLLRPGSGWPSPLYTSLSLNQPGSCAWISQHAIGAKMPNLNTGILSTVPLLAPPDALIEAFAELTRPLNKLSVSNDVENTTLATLCDTLLPKLISGELRVPEASALIKEATP